MYPTTKHYLVLTLLILFSTPSCSEKETSAQVPAHQRFDLKWKTSSRDGVVMFIETDLPDHAEVNIRISRSYEAISNGKQDTYSRDYLKLKEPISQWRKPKLVPLDAEAWKTDLMDFQSKMALLGKEMAFDIVGVHNYIDVSAQVFANKDGTFDIPEFDSLLEKIQNIVRVAESEIRVSFGLYTTSPIPQKSGLISWDNLEFRKSYRLLSEETPLMPGLVAQAFDDFEKVLYLPKGTVIHIGAITKRSGDFWYHVTVSGRPGLEGWINSIALIKDGVRSIGTRKSSTLSSKSRIPASNLLYADEIEKYVFEPCFRVSARIKGLDKSAGSMESAIQIMKSTVKQQLDSGIKVISENVSDIDDFSERMMYYEVGKDSCIEGAIANVE